MSNLANKHGQIWLNVAPSYLVLEDFVNLDNSPYVSLIPFYSILKTVLRPGHLKTLQLYVDANAKSPLLKHECRKPLPFQPNSVDHILYSHFIEHVYPQQAQSYDQASFQDLVISGGFRLSDDLRLPSADFRKNDGQSVHLFGQK